tara:strand:- start:10550 stop:11005 length:456 start_codon:yes stop_codon:yes gene_type:complete
MNFFDKNTIGSFKEEYFFLSNFYIHPITYEGLVYPSTEHAYVAAKSNDINFKIEVSQVSTAGKVKRLGRKVDLIKDWDTKKLIVMEDILRLKFSDPELSAKLLETGDAPLYEGNWWNDTMWGVNDKTGVGQNNLGKLLMKIRNEKKYKSIL